MAYCVYGTDVTVERHNVFYGTDVTVEGHTVFMALMSQ